MPRVFTVCLPVAGIAVTTTAELFELAPATGQKIRLVSMNIWQNTDLGDAQEEIIIISVNRRTGAATTGTGTAATPQPIGFNGTAVTAGCTAKVGMTANGTGGTSTPVKLDGFNIRGGYDRIFPPEERYEFVKPSGGATPIGMTVKIEAAPADSITFFGSLTFEEDET